MQLMGNNNNNKSLSKTAKKLCSWHKETGTGRFKATGEKRKRTTLALKRNIH